MYDIIIGRDEFDKKKYGQEGIVFLGKHYVKMGRTTSLSSDVYLDVAKSHAIFVCGKRGSGKSYTMGVIAEGIAKLPKEVAENLSIILLDTMGVYWSMKYPNKKDQKLLSEWGMKPEAFDVKIFTPSGFFEQTKKKGIPTDYPFSIMPKELDARDWCLVFDIKQTEPIGVLIERVIDSIKKSKKDYSIQDIITELNKDKKTQPNIKNAANNLFSNALNWGIFDKKGTPLTDLSKAGQITILDVSIYATMAGSWNIKSLAIGLITQKLFVERMIARREEEFKEISHATNYFEGEGKKVKKSPLVWLVIDEAHEFLPNDKETVATEPLVRVLREGRQPGISLILASQQPGKIHRDVMTQSDIIISHRITAKLDTDALKELTQSYVRDDLDKLINDLPRVTGSALILDDNNEKIFPMKIRPRITWHGGGAPSAVEEKKEEFGFGEDLQEEEDTEII
jgi:uncharacterized protein